MSEEIRRLLETQGGVASGEQVRLAGFSRRAVEAMVRRGEVVRVRRDVLVLAAALAEQTPWERSALLARAVGHSLALARGLTAPTGRPGSHALSHESALMVHGLPYFGEDGLVHLVRTDGRRGRRDGTVWVHRPVDVRWVVEVDGLRVMKPTMAALQVAATHGAEGGLVAVDGVLHLGWGAGQGGRRSGGRAGGRPGAARHRLGARGRVRLGDRDRQARDAARRQPERVCRREP